jgi:glucokinase
MIAAVDIGGTKIAVGIVSKDGVILARAESPSSPEHGARAGTDTITKMICDTLAQAGGFLHGIGIGCTGPVNPLTGVLGPNAFLPGWEGINLVDEFQNVFQVSSAIENDADAAALGEFAYGAGRAADRFIYLTVSTGIGGGIVLNGRLYRGVDGSHPEIGHHVIDPSGPKCFCGAKGCWESLAGGREFARSAGKQTAQEVCELARHGDAAALAAVERQGYYLGIGLANLITLFVPDVIALGGGVMQSLDLFQDKIREVIESSCGLVPADKTHLVSAALGRDVGLVGAAEVWKQRFGK